MSYNNIEVPYIESREDQNYMLLPYPNTFEDFYPYHPHERSFSCPKMIPDESCTATAEVSSSSDVKTSQADRSPLDEDAVKKQLRRIQNREAASRCRRKKMERISFLRETLNRMYHRCQELMQNINAVEAEVRQLKAACYGQHFAYGPHQPMKNGAVEEPLPDLCLCAAVTDGSKPVMENHYQPENGNHY